MYVHKLFNPAISSKTIQHAHPTLQKVIDCAQKTEREFLPIEEIQQTDPMRQQRLANMICYKCGQKGQYRKDYTNSICISPVLDQNLMYTLPTTLTQMVMASYAVPSVVLVTILKELAKAKQMNQQLRKSIQQTPSKQTPLMQPEVTRLSTTLKVVTTKSSTISKKTVQFTPKTTPNSSVKMVTPI